MRGWLLVLCLMAVSVPAQAVEVPASGTIEVLFTPWDDAEGALLKQVEAARQSIHAQIYLLTSRNISRALLAAHARGVRVTVLADREMLLRGSNSLLPQLHEAGIPVLLETRYAAAHNKILLIDAAGDHPVIITGSYNLSFSAQARNAENLLILRGNRALAQAYLTNWQRHRDEATPYAEALQP
ncbi:hypothetical protein MASR1M60_09250 [Rhodocyclaceae bacterium]